MSDIEIKFPLKEYKTERLIFRGRAVDQAKELYRLINSNRKHLEPWMPWVENTRSIEHTVQYIEMISGQWELGKVFDFSMFEKESNKLIGSFGLHSINWKNRTCHLGYWIDREFEGKGLISEAIKAGEAWAYDLGFHRICLTCEPGNERSKNSAFRNGYKLEAKFIDEIWNGNEWRDTLQFVKFLNAPIDGQITENFPEGFSLKEVEMKEYAELAGPLNEKIYSEREFFFRLTDVISKKEKENLDRLKENIKSLYKSFAILFYKGQVAGWTVGVQESAEGYHMINSAVLPEYRGRGLYSQMLDITVKKVIDLGYQKIYSYHNILNSNIITAKLKKDFKITGMEVNDFAGTMLQLTYYTNPTRKKAIEYRAGYRRPDEELKKLFKF